MDFPFSKRKLLFLLICLGGIAEFSSKAYSRQYVLTLPLIAVARESTLAFEFNLMNEASLSLHWSRQTPGEELRKKELEERPLDSLTLEGQEFGFGFQRYSNARELSGFYWGLGAGYRKVAAVWIRDPGVQVGSNLNNPLYVDDLGKVHNYMDVSGTAVNGKVGYRYIAKDLGLTAGLFLKLRHFQSAVKKNEASPDKRYAKNPLGQNDKSVLKRRLMTTLLPGFELGWAF